MPLPSIAAVALALAAAACVDAGSRLDEFATRLPDAAPLDDTDAASVDRIPDITGRWIVGLSPVVAPSTPLLFIADNELDDDRSSPRVTVLLTALDYTTRLPVGDTYVVQDIPINSAGQFDLEIARVQIPAEANPVTFSLLVVEGVVFSATIESDDRYCGSLDGMVTQPAQLSLSGSTFGAIRASDDAVGDELPAHEDRCPSEAD